MTGRSLTVNSLSTSLESRSSLPNGRVLQERRGRNSTSCWSTLLSYYRSWMNASGKQALGDGWEGSGASSKQEWQHSLPLGEFSQQQLSLGNTLATKEEPEGFWDRVIQVVMGVSFVVAALTWGAVIVASLFWASNTTPPFVLKDYKAMPLYQGGMITIDANVERDLDRRCSVKYSRKIVDSAGIVYSIEPTTEMSYNAIKVLEELNPGKLRINAQTSNSISTGWATVLTPLSYSCNPLQKIFPIQMVLKMRVQVMPWN